ncbi:MAG: 16S rRNA (uracil(1498)-N(3))-methyltransferase [Rickettsiales bacterium]|jgi:16S rRNA (uracil1498-N3)-methyltransferase|nr:16S rRNA (uracil(1498)-N(3))-methyltransferase [Rickettsiales bacterium]
MQNIPRIYLNENLELGKEYPLPPDTAHYLTKVMRVSALPKQDMDFSVFNNGKEFGAKLIERTDGKKSVCYALLTVGSDRIDPAGAFCLAFAPIKQSRLEEMLNMATQLGVARFQPVITERTVARHIKWERIQKIAIEASEQSGRNSIPSILPEIKFADFIKNNKNIIFADERFAHDDVSFRTPQSGGPGSGQDQGIENISDRKNICNSQPHQIPDNFAQSAQNFRDDTIILIGPEGGFSDKEFELLDVAGAAGISLGRTILRAETAAVVAIGKIDSR